MSTAVKSTNMGELLAKRGEGPKAHRAFLLWLMTAPISNKPQAIKGRPTLRLIRAIGWKARDQLNRARKKWEWVKRYEAIGEQAIEGAAEVYRQLYAKEHANMDLHAMGQVLQVNPMKQIGAGTESLRMAERLARTMMEAAGVLGPGAPNAEEAQLAQAAFDKEKKQSEQYLRFLQQMLIQMTKEFELQLKGGKIKCSDTTILKMLDMHERLEQKRAGVIDTRQGGGMRVQEPVAIVLAREAGRSVIDAQMELHAELGVALEQIKNHMQLEEVAAEARREQDENR